VQLEDGVNVPLGLEKDTAPPGDAPVTVAVQCEVVPSAITAPEHDTEVVVGGRVRTDEVSEGESPIEAAWSRLAATVKDGAKLVRPNTDSKNAIIPSRTDETDVLTASTMPPRPSFTVAVSTEGTDCLTSARPWPIEGASDNAAENEYTAAAMALTDGVSATETEFDIAARSWLREDESDVETALPTPARDWSMIGEREIDAESAFVKAAIALRVGAKTVETELASPAMPWLTAGVKETDCDKVSKKAATDERLGVSTVVPD